jgi:hypothetical protein
MTDFENYSKELFEAAKMYLRSAVEMDKGSEQQAALRSSLFHGYCFLEAQINYISEHFKNSHDFSVLEKSILLEKDFTLKVGKFSITNKDKFYRLDDRIEFLISKFSNEIATVKGEWFSRLQASTHLRNNLVHPKLVHNLSENDVQIALNSILEFMKVLHETIFKKKYPYANYGLVPKKTV